MHPQNTLALCLFSTMRSRVTRRTLQQNCSSFSLLKLFFSQFLPLQDLVLHIALELVPFLFRCFDCDYKVQVHKVKVKSRNLMHIEGVAKSLNFLEKEAKFGTSPQAFDIDAKISQMNIVRFVCWHSHQKLRQKSSNKLIMRYSKPLFCINLCMRFLPNLDTK